MRAADCQFLLDAVMEIADDCTVEISEDLVVASVDGRIAILGHRLALCLKGSHQAVVGVAKQFDIVTDR